MPINRSSMRGCPCPSVPCPSTWIFWRCRCNSLNYTSSTIIKDCQLMPSLRSIFAYTTHVLRPDIAVREVFTYMLPSLPNQRLDDSVHRISCALLVQRGQRDRKSVV